MKIKNKIRQDVSQVYNVLIPAGKWQEYLDMLDRDGHPNRKELCALMLIFGKHIETLEDLVEDLYFQIELLEGKKPAKNIDTQEIKLRNVIDIQKELQNQLDAESTITCFYVSIEDWKILENNVNPELAKTQPEFGYGKEVDPIDNKEKTCLYFKDLPVFKK